MRFSLKLTILCICFNFSAYTQTVPTPANASAGSLSWTKTASSSYTLYDDKGMPISDKYAKKLSALKSNTLAYLDNNTRIIYLLLESVDAAVGSKGKLKVLARDIGKDFYITNPNSFITYINDVSYTGKFVNVQGNYIYYLEEFDKTFYHEGIRSYTDWGARSIKTLPYAPNHTYWYRNVEKLRYGMIIKGETPDYNIFSTEDAGDDLIIKVNGVKTYRLPGYYTKASFVITPVEMYSAGTITTSNGCNSGNCNDGWGVWNYNGGYYEGFWKNGKKQGYGMYVWTGTGKYIGSWDNDNMNGYGAYIADNDDNIVGEYRDGKLNGQGYQVINGKWDQGWYSDGNITTSYAYTRNAGEYGCTSGDCDNKYGYFKWENGDHFVGFFNNGKLYLGTYTFADGNKYSGMFNSNNQYHGTGRFFFNDGAYYGGEWKNGKYSGRGYHKASDMSIRIGEWSDGTLIRSYQ